MWCIYREKNKGEKKKEVCNGHVTVARGRGREGMGGSSQRSYDRWGAGWGGRAGPSLTILGLSGPSSLARSARHVVPSGPSSIKPVGWSQALKKLNFRPGLAC